MGNVIVAALYALAGALFVAAALTISTGVGLAVGGLCIAVWTIRVLEVGE